MKKVIILIFLFVSFYIIGIEKKVEYDLNKEFRFETSKDKDYMYNYIKTWIYETFQEEKAGNANAEMALNILSFIGGTGTSGFSDKKLSQVSIIEENKEIGRIRFKLDNGIIDTLTKGYWFYVVDFTCQIDVKDNKYRIIFSNVAIQEWSMSMNGQNIYEATKKKVKPEYKDKVEKSLEYYAKNFKDILEKEKKQEDW